jgi:hypothetical protein
MGRRDPTALFVVIDAEKLTVEQRNVQLDHAINATGQHQRSSTDRVIHLIPKPCIETWIRCLLGEPVDERMDCKKLVKESDCHPAAELLAKMRKLNAVAPDAWLPSLIRGYGELDRLNS